MPTKSFISRIPWKPLAALAAHFAVCALFFIVAQRPLFYICNVEPTALRWGDFFAATGHGLRLDISAAGYLSFIPAFILIANCFMPKLNAARWIKIYDIAIGITVGLLTVADSAMYAFWHAKFNIKWVTFLGQPELVKACMPWEYFAVRISGAIALAAGLSFALLLAKKALKGYAPRRSNAIWLAGAITALFLCSRGVTPHPNHPRNAYYSSIAALNHTALNPIFNIIHTATRDATGKNDFKYMPDEERQAIVAEMFPAESGEHTAELLKVKRPNVVVIAIEGMGAALIESLGGEKGVTPNIDSLSRQSVWFTNCYCSGTITEKGITALHSGYPAAPTTAAIRNMALVKTLPGIAGALKEEGYATRFVYGGDPTYRNFSEYLTLTGHQEIIARDAFTPEQKAMQSWGVPDGIVLDRAYSLLMEDYKAGRTSYTTVLTLSSHMPWDVPATIIADDERLNAFAYTDRCIGDFCRKLKASPAWENTVVVVTADHGPHGALPDTPEFPRIPLFITGGAITAPMQIDVICSQTDIAATLLGAMGIGHSQFKFSRDVLDSGYAPVAYFAYPEGCIIIEPQGSTVFDITAEKGVLNPDPGREEKAKAMLQTIYSDMKSQH